MSREGFSISVIEAMACGDPVKIPESTGMSEIENTLKEIYEKEAEIEDYKVIKQDEKFLDNIIINIIYLLKFIKENRETNKIESLKRKISEEISKNIHGFLYMKIL